jgi:WD40 repeat protein
MISKIKHLNEEIVNFTVDLDQRLIVTFTNNNLLRFIAIEGQRLLRVTKLNQKLFCQDLSLSKDSKFLAIGFSNSTIKIMTVESLKETHNYKHHQMVVRRVAWHPNSQLLQVISADEEKNLVVFDYILNKPI